MKCPLCDWNTEETEKRKRIYHPKKGVVSHLQIVHNIKPKEAKERWPQLRR